MGEWRQPDRLGLRTLTAVAREHGVPAPEAFVAAMLDTGLVVCSEYYVPEARELFGLYRLLSWHLRDITGVGWVMCCETQEALMAQYGPNRMRVHAPMMFSVVSSLEEPTVAELEGKVMTVMERGRFWPDSATLLGLPVRIDPAARRPVFEVRS